MRMNEKELAVNIIVLITKLNMSVAEKVGSPQNFLVLKRINTSDDTVEKIVSSTNW